jgi:hypothetical protein
MECIVLSVCSNRSLLVNFDRFLVYESGVSDTTIAEDIITICLTFSGFVLLLHIDT